MHVGKDGADGLQFLALLLALAGEFLIIGARIGKLLLQLGARGGHTTPHLGQDQTLNLQRERGGGLYRRGSVLAPPFEVALDGVRAAAAEPCTHGADRCALAGAEEGISRCCDLLIRDALAAGVVFLVSIAFSMVSNKTV
ncbi:MAG: hypothetical protein MZW92_60895 [Comamonadaceae bacterium]|nr:hypothetical protein [Comamonadaceae bacterium]